jgi:hypothetical protein
MSAEIARVNGRPTIDIPGLRGELQTQVVNIQNSFEALARIENRLARQAANEEEIRLLRKILRNGSPSKVDYPDLMRRCFHAVNRLHKSCGMIGCDLCGLKQEIVGKVGAELLMRSNQIGRSK